MKILLTGATGYIGSKLLPVLLENRFQVVCSVKDKFNINFKFAINKNITIIENDFTKKSTLDSIPNDIDIAFYLIKSKSKLLDFIDREITIAQNFCSIMNQKSVKQVIFLSEIYNSDSESEILISRKLIEEELIKGHFFLTTIKAGFVIGSGNNSFEFFRNLIEKFPIIILPNYFTSKFEAVAISDLIKFLYLSIDNKLCFNKNLEIYSRKKYSIIELLKEIATIRKLKRLILRCPIFLNSIIFFMIYIFSPCNMRYLKLMFNKFKHHNFAINNKISHYLLINQLSVKKAIKNAFMRINESSLINKWKDIFKFRNQENISDYFIVPNNNCVKDVIIKSIQNKDTIINNVWAFEKNYNIFFNIKYLLFKKSTLQQNYDNKLSIGKSIKKWEILYANKTETRLLLYSNKEIIGEIWIDLTVNNTSLVITTTYRPKGIKGRIYLLFLYPIYNRFAYKAMNKLIV